jgi:hypothetical protein
MSLTIRLGGSAAMLGPARGTHAARIAVGTPETPSAIYDLKTGTATLSPSRIAQIRAHLPPGFQDIPVLVLRA